MSRDDWTQISKALQTVETIFYIVRSDCIEGTHFYWLMLKRMLLSGRCFYTKPYSNDFPSNVSRGYLSA